jgi:phospholysine phosphohistidine inorganic pyrophosphate phosphatase
MGAASSTFGVLLDIDGVLYVGDEAIDGAHGALAELRALARDVRLVTNTTSRSRREIAEHLAELGFDTSYEEIITPAAMAVRHCEEQGYESVELVVSDGLREDLSAFAPPAGERVQAVVLGDVGNRFDAELLNRVFRLLMDGAELIALQHNRYWLRKDGLTLDVGAYAAALEYATGREAVVVGKPSRAFFDAAVGELSAEMAVMIGDDVEADVGGAMAAGLAGVLVRTGKFLQKALPPEVTPTAIVDSIVDVPSVLERIFPR